DHAPGALPRGLRLALPVVPLTLQRQPAPTLFPYTTLFRSMDDHLRILQQHIQAVAIGRSRAADHRERMRRKIDEQKKEELHRGQDRKSTRLNSSHVSMSYAVFCLKKNNVWIA